MIPDKYLVAADVVVISDDRDPEILLIQRKNEPFKGAWALPGGFVDENEDLLDAALRELAEETNINLSKATQIGAYGKPGRDPRGRVISIAFAAVISKERVSPHAADDAKEVAWHKLSQLPSLAFDHSRIIQDARNKMLL